MVQGSVQWYSAVCRGYSDVYSMVQCSVQCSVVCHGTVLCAGVQCSVQGYSAVCSDTAVQCSARCYIGSLHCALAIVTACGLTPWPLGGGGGGGGGGWEVQTEMRA